MRKQGKLPGKLETAEFAKEYGTDVFAMQSDSIRDGQKVLIVDDLIATGMSEHCDVIILLLTQFRWLGCSSWLVGGKVRWSIARLLVYH